MKKAQKIAVISPDAGPVWPSAITIRRNLEAAYRAQRWAGVKFLGVDHHDPEAVARLAQTLRQRAFPVLVFPHALPVPVPLLKALAKFPDYRPELHFHVYGDFTISTPEWRSVARYLRLRRVRFYAASAAQARLLGEFLPAEAIRICPFPIDEKRFRFIASTPPKIPTLLYAGRLSRQKGIFLLLEWLARLRPELPEFRLQLAGFFDDRGTPLWGLPDPIGYTYGLWCEAIQRLGIEKQVELLGVLDGPELARALSRADGFVSLSLYHDEDYGLAPAEALLAGLPCVLSDWGGYASFARRAGDVELCRTSLGEAGLRLSYEDFRHAITRILRIRPTLAERCERALYFRDELGVAAIARALEHHLSRPTPTFRGFSVFLREHEQRVAAYRQGFGAYRAPSTRDSVYLRTYRHYVTSSEVAK